jgi:hypothetical protein
VSFLVGFETEFCLLKPATDDGRIVPVNDAPWAAARATLAGTPEAACMEALADALDASGIVLEMYHAEAAPGQVRALRAALRVADGSTVRDRDRAAPAIGGRGRARCHARSDPEYRERARAARDLRAAPVRGRL